MTIKLQPFYKGRERSASSATDLFRMKVTELADKKITLKNAISKKAYLSGYQVKNLVWTHDPETSTESLVVRGPGTVLAEITVRTEGTTVSIDYRSVFGEVI